MRYLFEELSDADLANRGSKLLELRLSERQEKILLEQLKTSKRYKGCIHLVLSGQTSLVEPK